MKKILILPALLLLLSGCIFDNDDTSELYQNNEYGFAISLPDKISKKESSANKKRPTITFKNTNLNFDVRLYIDLNKDLNNFHWRDKEADSKGLLAGNEANIYKAPNGYCDGPGCSFPYIAYATKYDGNFYILSFYGDAELSEEEKRILESFNFVK